MSIIELGTGEEYKTLSKLWQLSLGSAIYSDIIAGDIDGDGNPEIIIVDDTGTLFVVDISGNVLWKFESGESGSVEDLFLDKESIKVRSSSPVLYDINDDGKPEIIFGSETGKLYAIDNKGNKLFEFSADGPIRSTAAISDINNDGVPEIIFGSSDNHIYILDAEGKQLRKFAVDGEVESGIVVEDINNDGNLQIIFGCEDNKLYVMDFDGNKLWAYQAEGPIKSTPTVTNINGSFDKSIIFGCDDGNIYVLSNKGSLQASYDTKGRVISKVIVDDVNEDSVSEIITGTCSYEDNLVMLNPEGKLLDSFSAGFWVVSSPVLIEKEAVVFGSYDHRLYVLGIPKSPSNSMRSKVKIFDTGSIIVSTPVVLDHDGKKMIVTGNDKGEIFALVYG